MPWRNAHPTPPVQHAPQAFLSPASKRAENQAATGTQLQATLGMVSVRAREQMVQRLEQANIAAPAVLAAMRHVPRHAFVDTALASRAYDDATLPIGFKQTISAPAVVARMVSLACEAVFTNGAWLEIGTGCGYQAAVMAHCTAQVCSVERVQGLAELAKAQLAAQGLGHIALLHGDGTVPWHTQFVSSHGKHGYVRFDAIVVAAAGLGTPQTWLDQLNIGGRLLTPLQDALGVQRLHCITRLSETQFEHRSLEPVQFVPLLGGVI